MCDFLGVVVSGVGCSVQVYESGIKDLWLRVWGVGFRFYYLAFRV
jgi:hypothetical protein